MSGITKQDRYFPLPETPRRLVYDMNLVAELWRRHSDLSTSELIVLLAYRDRCDWKARDDSGAGYVSQKTLAEDTRLHHTTAAKRRRALMRKGYLEPDYRGQDDDDTTPYHPAVPEEVWQAFEQCVSKRHRRCQYQKRERSSLAWKVSSVIQPGRSHYQPWRNVDADEDAPEGAEGVAQESPWATTPVA